MDRPLKFYRKRWFIGLCFFLLLTAQLTVLLYFGGRKSGFHEDELYSFYSTNKTAGLFVEDRQWLYREQFANDFTVLAGEQFRYLIVKQMQSWDVHPPFYYYVLHTICSLFPGMFNKWLGIAVNLLAYVPCFVLLALLAYETVSAGGGKEEKDDIRGRSLALSFVTCLFWGFSPAAISGVLFIRMYQWLTCFILLCAYLHIRALKRQRQEIWFYPALAATVFLGFLTQYYYIIFHFFLGAAYCIYLMQKKRIRELFLYGLSCIAGFLAAVAYYPASLSHIFRGYRGTEAVSEFSNVGNTAERLDFFFSLFNQYGVSGLLPLLLLAIVLLRLTLWAKRKQEKNPACLLLLTACLGYFFTVSKTALLLGNTSVRYQLPIYGIGILLLLHGAAYPACYLLAGRNRAVKRGLVMLCLLAGLFWEGKALAEPRVIFLYEEERETMQYIQENKEVPVLVFYNEASPDNVWRLADQLMVFQRVYLASEGNPEPIEEPVFKESSRLLVYAADHEQTEACLKSLLEGNPNLREKRVAAKKGLWTLYELSG